MNSREKSGRSSDLTIRTVVSLVLIIIAAAALWFGHSSFWVLVTIAGLLMLGEWAGLHKANTSQTRIAQFALCVPLAIISPFAAGPDFFALGLLAGAAFFAVIVTQRPMLALGVLYIGFPIFALIWLRDQPGGLLYCFWALALVWATDIGAYFSGRAIGGPKIAPRISPNKTWAGLVGGTIAALIFGLALHHYFALPLILALATPFLAIIAQIGDFYESWLKRRAGVKDSGTLLPGHGGVLDRLDGLVPVAPIAALLVILISL